MSALHEAVDDYIAIRRSLGFKLEDYPWTLHDLVDYLESHGESKITTHLALEWAHAQGPDPTCPTWASGCAWRAASPGTCARSTPTARCRRPI